MATKVQFLYNEDYSMGAMYVNGDRVLEGEVSELTAESAIDQLAFYNISIALDTALVVKADYDAEVYAFEGFPDDLADIPPEALVD